MDRLERLDDYERTPYQEDRGKNFMRYCNIIGKYAFKSEARVFNPYHIGPTLGASGSYDKIKLIYDDKIYCMTTREMYVYMGFTREDYKKVMDLNILSRPHLMTTAGNSISVEVLESIFKKITRP